MRTARYRLEVRAPTTSWRVPSHGIALRRCQCLRRFVPTLEGASQGATVEAPCRSCPKRGGDRLTAAHEVKRRPRVFVRALDGVKSLVTRAGFLRAEPLGVSFVQPFLHEQKRTGRRRQKLLYKLRFVQSAQHFLPANAIQNLAINDVLC